MWQERFEQYLGPMQMVGHGVPGFKTLYKALLETRLKANPIAQEGIDNQYYCFEFPGQACDAIPDKDIQEFIVTLSSLEKSRITRLDLAWDGVPFTPEQVKEAIDKDHVRSYLRRKSMSYTVSPYEDRKDGELGTSSLKLGSRFSERMLRVYNERGPVRIEMQTKKQRADLVAKDLLIHPPFSWVDKAIGHLRDYVDFIDGSTGKLLPWWDKFTHNQDRAMKTISNAREVTLNGMLDWVNKAVSPTLSVIADLVGMPAVEAFVEAGRRKRGSRFNALLNQEGNNDDPN
jgi:DNA relaxase NicK